MTKRGAALLLLLLFALLPGCAKKQKSPVFDGIRTAAAARFELPGGKTGYMDSGISLMSSELASMRLVRTPLEPADREEDWLYRIVFNPSEKVKNAQEIPVSFHADYVQIGTEYYTAEAGVPYDSILRWAESTFDECFKNHMGE